MADSIRPPLKAVDASDRPPVKPRRGPGVAVIAIAIYALLFMGALWWFKWPSRFQSPQSKVVAPAPAPAPSREALIAGTGLSPIARDAYLLRLDADRCDCGCEMSVAACLTRDRTCVRSPELAGKRMRASLASARP